jgi:nucleolar protein 56
LDVNREDKPIIQSICLLELLDKDVNTLSMRIREWFSWHFPELSKLITDGHIFTKLANLIQNRDKMKNVTVEEV